MVFESRVEWSRKAGQNKHRFLLNAILAKLKGDIS